jgi:hypothetical protein
MKTLIALMLTIVSVAVLSGCHADAGTDHHNASVDVGH